MSVKPAALVVATFGMAVKAWVAFAAFLFIRDLCRLKKEGKQC